MCRLKVNVKGNVHNVMFVVVPKGQSLLGDKACEDLGLVRRIYQLNKDTVEVTEQGEGVNSIVDSFPGIFKGQGTLPFTYKIQ